MNRVPLPRTFMLTSMLGILIVTVYTVSGRISLEWGAAFDFVFVLMFIASVLSITPPWLQKEEPIEKDMFAASEAMSFVKSSVKPRKSVKRKIRRKRRRLVMVQVYRRRKRR